MVAGGLGAHRSVAGPRRPAGGGPGSGQPEYEVAAAVLGEVRKAKTGQQRSMRAGVDQVVVHDTAERLAALALVADDVREAGRVRSLDTTEAEEFAVEVELAESDAA